MLLCEVDILGIKIDRVDINQAVAVVDRHLSTGPGCMLVVTPNSEMIVRAVDDKSFARILNGADLKVADGAGVVFASRLLQKPLPERVAGFDLMQRLLNLAQDSNYNVYLLGSKPGIAEKAGHRLKQKYRTLQICGYHNGYFTDEETKEVIEEINELQPDLLFVGMGVPRQEKFLADNIDNLKAGVAMTVGGSIDILAGESKRAPGWLQRLNLEWFYRLVTEPSRLGRMMALPRFVVLILKEAIGR